MALRPSRPSVGRPPFDMTHGLFAAPRTFLPTATSIPSGQHATGAVNQSTRLLQLPSLYRTDAGDVRIVDCADFDSALPYFLSNLNVDRLVSIHKHLWLAGLPRNPRPLHAQVLLDRKICVSEDAGLHLLREGRQLYVKPFPDYLACFDVWEHILCRDQAIFAEGRGFLLSYLCLICDRIDLKVAHEHGLVSEDISWDEWSTFSRAAFSHLDFQTLDNVNIRYMYGELRLDRINTIYRLCSKTSSWSTFMRGYRYPYHDYSTFMERNFAWAVTFVVYIGLVLTAMQVGLATGELGSNVAFNRASFGFTVFAIISPLIVGGSWGLATSLLTLYNVSYAIKQRREATLSFRTLLASQTAQKIKH